MSILLQSASSSQNKKFSIENVTHFVQVDNDPLLASSSLLNMLNEYPKRFDIQNETNTSQSYSELESPFPKGTAHILLTSHPTLSTKQNKEALKNLKNKIQKVYNKHQIKNWDGYNAQPLKWLPKALQFADILFQNSYDLIESVDIIPENDGCLCFEWFKSNNCLISISIKDDIIIYNYKIESTKGCGEVTLSGSYILIDQIKKVVRGDF